MNLQDKINWFKLNGWLEHFECEATLADITSYDGNVRKMTAEPAHFVARWDGAHTTCTYTQQGATKNEAIENLYAFIGEHLWKAIRSIEGYDPPDYL